MSASVQPNSAQCGSKMANCHYYGFDCTELHLLSIDSIAASLFENIWLPNSSQYQRTR